jgi:hypothetical protein
MPTSILPSSRLISAELFLYCVQLRNVVLLLLFKFSIYTGDKPSKIEKGTQFLSRVLSLFRLVTVVFE